MCYERKMCKVFCFCLLVFSVCFFYVFRGFFVCFGVFCFVFWFLVGFLFSSCTVVCFLRHLSAAQPVSLQKGASRRGKTSLQNLVPVERKERRNGSLGLQKTQLGTGAAVAMKLRNGLFGFSFGC